MNRDSTFSFLFSSEILGRKIEDRASGSTIGSIVDLVASTGEVYPIVHAAVVRLQGRGQGNEKRLAPLLGPDAQALSEGRPVAVDPAALLPVELKPNDFLIRDLLLDKQIVDVQGAKVERVNDVHLLLTDRIRIIHVDVGFSGLLRRLGVERPVRSLWRLSRRPLADELISWKFVQPLESEESPTGPLRLRVEQTRIRDLHPGELADILEDLGKEEREAIVHALGPEFVADVLEEAEEDVQAAVISQLEPSVAADILEEMDPGEAADILTALPEAHTDEIIAEVEAPERAHLERLIAYPEKTAASLMTPEYVAVPIEATVDDAMREVRRQAEEIEAIYYVYVVDGEKRLKGVTTLRSLLRAWSGEKLTEIMTTRLVTVGPDAGYGEVAETFLKYSFLATPVVDEEGRMMGVILLKHAFDELLPDFRREA
jgi:CBS domain-containing protein